MLHNFKTLGLLVRLRYKLLWAQARTSAGKAAIFFALYLLGMLFFSLIALGGVGAGILTVQAGGAEVSAQLILGSLFLTGNSASLLMGVGPSAAFSDDALRRYPLSRKWRFTAQHLVGLLDPVWLFIFGTLFGLAIGFQFSGVSPFVVSLPVLLVFLGTTYLCAADMLIVVRRILQFRAGPVILMIGGVAAILVFVLLTSSGLSTGEMRIYLARLLGLTPAKTAAAAVAGNSPRERTIGLALLLTWFAASAMALRLLQGLQQFRGTQRKASIGDQSIYDIGVQSFPKDIRPLVAKSLAYHLRCNRVRYSLIMTGPLLLFISFMGHHAAADRTLLFLTFMFIAGFFSTLVMSVNYFGWDGAGVRRYLLLPVPISMALRAHSYASLLLGAMGAIFTTAIGILALKIAVTTSLLVFVLFDVTAGLFVFHALSLWIAVLVPKRAEFGTMMGNVVSLPAKILLIGGMVPIMVVNSGLGLSSSHLLDRWDWMLAASVAALLMYVVSLKMAGSVLCRRQEQLVESVAGAVSN